MKKLITTLGVFTLLSAPVFAETVTFSGAQHCSEDVVKNTTAVNTLIKNQGTLNALKIIATESVGTVEQGYFHFDPQFERSNRTFNCSIPLNDQMGSVEVGIFGKVNGLNSSNGGCEISRMRKVQDAGVSKWFKFGTGGAFDWTSIQNSNVSGEQFVSYITNLNNQFEGNSTLELKCRTTWLEGSVALGQVTLTY